MNKNAIQKYAIWARTELIEQIKQRAFQYGITEKGFGEENATVINGRVLTIEEKRQRQAFVTVIKQNGFNQAVEEVAYTWFNRFVALRYMEVNDYLPTHIRVFSDANGDFNPEILKSVLHLELPNLDKTKVSELLNANKTDELYRYLLLTQCNALNELLPEMFEQLGTYTEMLLPNNILRPESVIGRLVSDISEEDFRDAVQIIGWLYQYYNTEPKQLVFDGLKKNIKITKENIPAATQLFTPDWIVRYMVENSLGRLWLESHPNSSLRENWKYYLDEAEQTPEVTEQLRVLRKENAINSPEDMKVIDPCMGSGHILVYAFDVLMQIYVSEGYSERDAAQLILEKNIYGLDIDRRAFQLAYFSLMMKARQYNRRILTLGIRPQVYEPTGYEDGMEFGSLIQVDTLESMPEQPKEQIDLFEESYETKLNTWNYRRLLSQKYDVVITNPPYMGSKGMSPKLSEFVSKKYPDSKSDLFAVFIERGLELVYVSGYSCMVTMQSWMFLSSYEKLRNKILSQQTISNLMHMENMVMGIAFGTAVTNLYGKYIKGYKGFYNHVELSDILNDAPVAFPTVSKRNRATSSENFVKIPGSPIAYWASKVVVSLFENTPIGEIASPVEGIKTGENEKYLRLWFEINALKISLFNLDSNSTDLNWVFTTKGGSYRKWYGNIEYVIDWSNNADSLKLHKGSSIYRNEYFDMHAITWTYLTAGDISFRDLGYGYLYNNKGPAVFSKNKENLIIICALMNSCVGSMLLGLICSTLTFLPGDVKKIPLLRNGDMKSIVALQNSNVELSKNDWDSFENSWDFKRHPLIRGDKSLINTYENWVLELTTRFNKLKQNEEELNRIFIDIYGLQDELTPEVEDKDVTVRLADVGRDIRSLISYAVGCMFGRYSLDSEGLIYAGGEWDSSKYQTFPPDPDNIIPICDDEYFDDDITGRFVEFIKTVYGVDTLEENLKFISDALGGRGTSREVIRNYFLNDFYKDHLKIYQKRPIYWMFDSGKKNGFKALIYMHRYSRDLLAKLRTDYVHEQQERYRTQLSHVGNTLNNATGAERAKLLKQQEKLTDQLREITVFEEKVHHLADKNIPIDLDDGVKHNYAIFTDVLAKI